MYTGEEENPLGCKRLIVRNDVFSFFNPQGLVHIRCSINVCQMNHVFADVKYSKSFCKNNESKSKLSNKLPSHFFLLKPVRILFCLKFRFDVAFKMAGKTLIKAGFGRVFRVTGTEHFTRH